MVNFDGVMHRGNNGTVYSHKVELEHRYSIFHACDDVNLIHSSYPGTGVPYRYTVVTDISTTSTHSVTMLVVHSALLALVCLLFHDVASAWVGTTMASNRRYSAAQVLED